MWNSVKILIPGIFLIFIASTIILLSDFKNRIDAEQKNTIPHIAILQYATSPIMDEGVDGALKAICDSGYTDGENIIIQRFNAENDMPTANSIARRILDGNFDMVMTFSTPCLQAMALVNKEAQLTHIFSTVTDPFGAGVGINREDPLDHPPYMAGIGTFQPVREVIRLAKEMYPDLNSLGVVWNPAEACSEACTRLARDECKKLGIKLHEAEAGNSKDVAQAAQALAQRGIQAFWVGGDNTVELAVGALVKVAEKERIPVFTNLPSDIDKGVFFGLGANYIEVGYTAGKLAVKIIEGYPPSKVSIENVVPQKLMLNMKCLENFRDPWKVTNKIKDQSDRYIDKKGKSISLK
jgi:putative tryptophan/tyrosine transport system substrate-binding protein